MAPVIIKGYKHIIIIDSGAEVNIILRKYYNRVGLSFIPHNNIKVVNVHGNRKRIIGVCDNVDVSIGNIYIT